MSIRIAGGGCCLMDILHPDVDFSSPAFAALRSRREGDGGLSPGRLVFAEDAERFSGKSLPELLRSLVGERPPAAENVGGPSAVALIHAAQMLEGEGARVSFHGARGADEIGGRLDALLRRSPLALDGYRTGTGRTPSTFVLSDPRWDSGRGERCFVNEIGAAAGFLPAELGCDFFGADIVALGGTALTPALHEGLPGILAAARARGALTLVNTVFDFLNESRAPGLPWPLGPASGRAEPGPAESYRECDLLLMDRDEALRLSGRRDLPGAFLFFASSGLGAFAISRGADSVLAWAKGGRFAPLPASLFPVLERGAAGSADGDGDTTGCGDAFAGGIIASLAMQLAAGRDGSLDLSEAIGWGIAGGAFTLSILGGTYFEERRGEKRSLVEALRRSWPGHREDYRDEP